MAPTIVSLSDIEALANRLMARAKSRMLNEQPNVQADLLLAGKLLTLWVRDCTIYGATFTLDD
jgi:hypothetical protein